MLNFTFQFKVFAVLTFLQIWQTSAHPAVKSLGTERESTPLKAVSQFLFETLFIWNKSITIETCQIILKQVKFLIKSIRI